jgi:heme/copper-type cytochrome/quinol oxidase subunit 2
MVESDGDKQPEEQEDGLHFTRFMVIGVGALILVIVLIFGVGIGLAVFADPARMAPRIELIRDILIIVMTLEGVLIVLGLAVLVLQVTRLIVMLQQGTRPVIENAQETVEIAKGTARFVSKNVARPVIGLHALVSAISTFFREIGGIRRAIRPSRPNQSGEDKVNE